MELLRGTCTIENVTAFLASLEDAVEGTGVTVQAFDGRYVAGRRHLAVAVRSADRAIAQNEAIADNRAVEICCYAAGRRQIGDALEMGISPGTGSIVVLVEGENESQACERIADMVPQLAPIEEPMDSDPEVLAEFHDITEGERRATRKSLEDLVCERVVLLAVEK